MLKVSQMFKRTILVHALTVMMFLSCHLTPVVHENASSLFLVDASQPSSYIGCVWKCRGNNALGPDSFSFSLVQAAWDIIKKDFCDTLSEFHKRGRLKRRLMLLS